MLMRCYYATTEIGENHEILCCFFSLFYSSFSLIGVLLLLYRFSLVVVVLLSSTLSLFDAYMWCELGIEIIAIPVQLLQCGRR